MATTTLTLNPQKITLPDTAENDINFDDVLGKLDFSAGYAICNEFSAATQFNSNGMAITAASGSYSSGNVIIPIERGTRLRYKGSAAATFTITIVGP